MRYKGSLNSITKSIALVLQSIPHILQDTFSLINHFYQNSPPLKSRALGVFLKAGFETFIWNNNPLSKDGNPVVSSVVREGVNVLPISYNVLTGAQHVSGKPEILEEFYWMGQLSRFACKATPQLLLGTNIIASRLSNIGCDSFAIIGNDLSKMSQLNSSKQIYWFWSENNTSIENIWAGDFA